MIIEKLKMEDIEALLKLYEELVPFEMLLKNSLETSVEIYKEILKDKKYLILTAKEEGKVIGSVLGICCKSIATGKKPFLVIEDVIVDEKVRGKGIGKKLIKAIEDFGKENNCVYGILVSSGFRKEAHKFYESLGFTEDVRGFRKMYD